MKIPITIRIEESVLNATKKLAAENKIKFTQPDNYNRLIEQALVELLRKNKVKI